ncbi:MAG: MFS transporter [Burkholderiales bacterium]|jgi:MFS family permease|nr:MFS transporter [Burkholderiales bacterium]
MRFPPLRLSILVWGLAAVFYMFGFFQRVTPAALGGDLMRDFGLTAAALGNLSAFYYYAYAAMQIPTGILVDRLGPSRLFFAGAILSGIGALLFALAESVVVAGLGRALIGASHGLAWVSMLTLAAHWFPPTRFGTMSGLSLAVGTLGAVLAGPPLRWLADDYGWRTVIAVSGGFALLLAVAIRIWMRDDPLDRRYLSYAPPSAHPRVRHAQGAQPPLLHLLAQALRYRNPLLIFWVNSGICGAFLAFTGLWGVPFFVQQHGLTVKQASLITAAMLVVFAVSGPVWGALSDRWRLRKRPFVLGATLTAAGFALLALFPAAPLALLIALMLAAAFGAGAMVLSFGYAKESVPAPVQGAVTGLVNAGVMFGTLVQMPVIGLILDRFWQGVVVNGVRQYGLEAFQAGLLFLAGWIVVSYLLLLATRETHARAAH